MDAAGFAGRMGPEVGTLPCASNSTISWELERGDRMCQLSFMLSTGRVTHHVCSSGLSLHTQVQHWVDPRGIVKSNGPGVDCLGGTEEHELRRRRGPLANGADHRVGSLLAVPS